MLAFIAQCQCNGMFSGTKMEGFYEYCNKSNVILKRQSVSTKIFYCMTKGAKEKIRTYWKRMDTFQ